MKSEHPVPAAPTTPVTGSKAGRNLPAAIGVGVGLALMLIASLAFNKAFFVVVLCVAVVISVIELATAFRARQIQIPVFPVALGGFLMQPAAYLAGEQGLLITFVCTCVVVLMSRVLRPDVHALRDIAAGVFAAAYVPFLAAFAALMVAAPDGHWRVVVFLLVTTFSDIGGYVAGVLFGRHPLAPSVSPKKSWEGLIGSLVFSGAVGAVSVSLALHGSWLAGIACGFLGVFTGTVGDLSESLLKRDLGIKDMGNLLPGHGGLMDRMDSLLPTAPVMFLVLTLLVGG